jgi:uncharacterized protein YjbI with pentapeptide repeats
MIAPQRAPVRPRVFVDGCSDTLLLEDEIADLLAAGKRGLVALIGDLGSGKTTALQHLAAVFPSDNRLLLLDELGFATAAIDTLPIRLTIYTAAVARQERHVAAYRLARWTKDDLIEYLLALHRPRCASVMARIPPAYQTLLGGAPELCRVVLDRLASDETIPGPRRALHRHLEEGLIDTDLLERARSACLNFIFTPAAEWGQTSRLRQLAGPGFADGLFRVLRHPAAQFMLASERIAADLHGDCDCDYLAKQLTRALVQASASLLANDPRAVEHLLRLLAGPSWSHAMSASLLHAAGIRWTPPARRAAALTGAYLNGIAWSGVDLSCAALDGADLSGAYLSGATLTGANARGANLSRASMQGAMLLNFFAAEADLSYAILWRVLAHEPMFGKANLEGADFTKSMLRKAHFAEASLTNAIFCGACLSGAVFISPAAEERMAIVSDKAGWLLGVLAEACAATGPRLDGADFTNADLSEAVLSGLDLCGAAWTGARFARAKMRACNLENVALPAADFTEANLLGAFLTATSMPGASFKGADLRLAHLADVDWEGANLADADLRGSTFHMGSTRSGLVGSPIACEGSRTGFYTDDYDEQTHKAPEEIRKANLCGADLRGANVEGVDFYLVDLRGAHFDEEQEQHFRRCGAILS